jgi:CheY-specific phosphatase CheX
VGSGVGQYWQLKNEDASCNCKEKKRIINRKETEIEGGWGVAGICGEVERSTMYTIHFSSLHFITSIVIFLAVNTPKFT